MDEQIRIDYLFPANHIEVINGLVYVHGGGWTEVHRVRTADSPLPTTSFGVVVAILVPWAELNRPHGVAVWVEKADQKESSDEPQPLLRMETQMLVGQRIPRAGLGERVQIGFPAQYQFPAAGAYRVVAQVDDMPETRQWDFFVNDLITGA
jgi:hypothetical protein